MYPKYKQLLKTLKSTILVTALLSLLFRAMVLNGYLLKLDLPEIRELIRLMKNLTNNVNQMAKSLHEQGSIYETEIDDVKQRLGQTWDILREILSRLDRSEK